MYVAAGAKGGKMRACKLQEVSDLLPIGWEIKWRENFSGQSQSLKLQKNQWRYTVTRSLYRFNPRYILVRYLQQLLDEVQQNIAICQWQADQLYIFRSQRLRQIIDLRDTDKSRYLG